MTEPLPELLDSKRIQAETVLSRAAAGALMRRVPKVQIKGLRKTYVARADVLAELDRCTHRV